MILFVNIARKSMVVVLRPKKMFAKVAIKKEEDIKKRGNDKSQYMERIKRKAG
jgi:hypothetical protein